MSSLLPVALFALSGVLIGGLWSMRRQGSSGAVIGLMAVLALLAAVGGVLWLLPGDG
ncbi:hypothetical protein ACN27G_19890 [Plantactinospora sp. WMMB334]|uniref:hypothetical protein n=1 Tax=Plantactinospora sp. WMMB334 TaxID=3404119 RepID=UPI003B9383C1